MMILKAFLISTLASGAAFFMGAVVLAILNIYLAGHGIDWPNQQFESGMTGMSPLSVLLGIFVLLVFGVVFLAVMVASRSGRSSDEPRAPE